MKLGLEEKIQALIDGFKANNEKQQEAFRAIYEPLKSPEYVNRFTSDGLRLMIKEQVDDVMKNWKQYNTTLNQSLKEAVAAAKATILSALGMDKQDKPVDYATRIANAREFLKDELGDLPANGVTDSHEIEELDASLHLILKDFIADYDTMTLFLKMVERVTPVINPFDGTTLYPKTFGRLFKVRNAMETIESLEGTAEIMFLYDIRDSDETVRINGMIYSVPRTSGSEIMAENAAIDSASFLDDFADNIDNEGYEFESGGSVQKLA